MKRGFTLIELLVVIAIIAILAAILFPVFAKAREKARQTQCINNQKQFSMAVQMFTQENEETLPESKTFWTDIDVPAKVKLCPTAGKKVTNAYVFNNTIGGMSLGDIKDPVGTLLTVDGQHDATADTYANVAYDEKDLNFRHNNALITSYVDGHVSLDTQVPFMVDGFEKAPSDYPGWMLWGQGLVSGWPDNAFTIDTGDPYQGNQCLNVHYKFTADHGIEYSAFQIWRWFSFPVSEARIAVYGQASSNLCIKTRIQDANGEIFQYTFKQTNFRKVKDTDIPERVNFDGWQVLSTDITKPEGYWGGDGNGKVDFPCAIQCLLLENGGAGSGNIKFDNLTMIFHAAKK